MNGVCRSRRTAGVSPSGAWQKQAKKNGVCRSRRTAGVSPSGAWRKQAEVNGVCRSRRTAGVSPSGAWRKQAKKNGVCRSRRTAGVSPSGAWQKQAKMNGVCAASRGPQPAAIATNPPLENDSLVFLPILFLPEGIGGNNGQENGGQKNLGRALPNRHPLHTAVTTCHHAERDDHIENPTPIDSAVLKDRRTGKKMENFMKSPALRRSRERSLVIFRHAEKSLDRGTWRAGNEAATRRFEH
jgi:hypothetical protein